MPITERRRLGRALGLAAAGAVVLALSACGGDDDSPSAATGDTSAAATTDTGGAPAPDGTDVTIADFAFSPDTLDVAVGTTVVWTNDDPTTHTVTADDDSFGSDGLGQGDSFEHTFDTAGEHTYHCNIHPSMQATIVVG